MDKPLKCLWCLYHDYSCESGHGAILGSILSKGGSSALADSPACRRLYTPSCNTGIFMKKKPETLYIVGRIGKTLTHTQSHHSVIRYINSTHMHTLLLQRGWSGPVSVSVLTCMCYRCVGFGTWWGTVCVQAGERILYWTPLCWLSPHILVSCRRHRDVEQITRIIPKFRNKNYTVSVLSWHISM